MSQQLSDEFSEFWYRYPRRIGKLAAQRAYTKARKLTSATDILTGIETYISTKPTWQEWAHPSSWLNAGRWMDEAPVRKASLEEAWRAPVWQCPHTPNCPHPAACRIVAARTA